MAYEVRETPEAKQVHEKVLRGAARRRYETFLAELAAQGCKAGGKRLRVRGDEVSRYCARGFYGRWRAHLVFEDFDDPPPPLDQAKVDLIEALLGGNPHRTAQGYRFSGTSA